MLDLCAAFDPHQNLVDRKDGHTLYDLPDGGFVPFCDCLCGILYSLLRLLHAGADAVSCQEAEVVRVSPLQVRVGQDVLDAEKYCMSDVFSEGEAVWYMEIAGQGFVQPMHAN